MNKVPKGVLYDKVLSLADLFSFKDDAGQKPSSNPLHFHQAYFEYYHALIDSTNTTHPDSLISIIEKDYSANTHPFVLLKADIATIKKDAIDSGILTIDSAYCLHENSNSTTSPYDVQSVSLTSLGLISRLQSQTIRLMAPNPTTPN